MDFEPRSVSLKGCTRQYLTLTGYMASKVTIDSLRASSLFGSRMRFCYARFILGASGEISRETQIESLPAGYTMDDSRIPWHQALAVKGASALKVSSLIG